jgi:uncharacterized protein YbjT (DUF2867 family)
MNERTQSILVTGATGYIGGRLVPELLAKGHHVRLLVRDSKRLAGRDWLGKVEVVEGDVLKGENLKKAFDGIEAAYYLIHSMMTSSDFHDSDILAARNFVKASEQANVLRIIYLGGLGDSDEKLSPHLRSRQATGEELRKSAIPVTEFRAAVIVGSGSVSFEMVRYLTERIPVMICPRWVFTRIQPIGIADVLEYLVQSLNVSESERETIEIGGSEVITYGEMMHGYAEVRGLKRTLIEVPVLTPRLSSYWIHWMTPIPSEIARPLIEGLRNEVVVTNDKARRIFPGITPVDYRTAVRIALDQLNASHIETTWSDSLSSSQKSQPAELILANMEGMIVEKRQRVTKHSSGIVYERISSLGGENGWLYMNWAWRLRGMLDRIFGGVGFRRGRRDPQELRAGDAVDFWRVETVQPGKLIRFRAEMKVPGKAWLQFEVDSGPDSGTVVTQTAFFAPKGLTGFLYWYILYPVHSLIFSGLIRNLTA